MRWLEENEVSEAFREPQFWPSLKRGQRPYSRRPPSTSTDVKQRSIGYATIQPSHRGNLSDSDSIHNTDANPKNFGDKSTSPITTRSVSTTQPSIPTTVTSITSIPDTPFGFVAKRLAS